MDQTSSQFIWPIQVFIHKGATTLNDEKWFEFLGLCDEEKFRYQVLNFSPEIRREQCWADRNYAEMKKSFELLPRHNSDHSRLTRQLNVKSIEHLDSEQQATVVSSLVIYKTHLDGVNSHIDSGSTSLYVVGEYRDQIQLDNEKIKLISRIVYLDTRQLDIGSHKIF